MFGALLRQSGGVNRWTHVRVPTPLDEQTVIRMNRDTLYSTAVVDLADGATLTLPDAADRYLSAMVVNQGHYINAVFHDAGSHALFQSELGSRHVLVAVRILVDSADQGDIADVNLLQDQLGISAGSADPPSSPDFDQESLTATRQALLQLAAGLGGLDHAFGRREAVDPVRHLIATAAGWGGLPESEAYYINVSPELPVGEYRVDVPATVPVDGFWSISVYNADGFFQPSDGAVSVNNLTAVKNRDGSITVHFGGPPDGRPNRLPITEGWNFLIRLYRPRPEVLDGSWTFPAPEPTS